jgi:NAD(P)-dependent dehydrogenase (short-subunit alcohol dehydrogenase family)
LKRFLGKTALVTGASRGIGAAVALRLAKQGADVAINFRSKGSRAEDIASQVRGLGRRALLAQADLTDANSVEAPKGGCVVFVTSHLAHFYGRKPVYAAYEGIAASGALPTVQEFAAAIVEAAAAAHQPNGHVSFVGATD